MGCGASVAGSGNIFSFPADFGGESNEKPPPEDNSNKLTVSLSLSTTVEKHPEIECIAILFGGGWDEATKKFVENALKIAYATINNTQVTDGACKKVEIIFVERPNPKDPENTEYRQTTFVEFTNKLPWRFLPLREQASIEALEKRYGNRPRVSPQLVLLTREGALMNSDAVGAVQRCGADTFPWRDANRRISVFNDAILFQFPGIPNAVISDAEMVKRVKETLVSEGVDAVPKAHGAEMWAALPQLATELLKQQSAPKCGKCKGMMLKSPGVSDEECGKCNCPITGTAYACKNRDSDKKCDFVLCGCCAEPNRLHESKLNDAEKRMLAVIKEIVAAHCNDQADSLTVSLTVTPEDNSDSAFTPNGLLDLTLKYLDEINNVKIQRAIAEVIIHTQTKTEFDTTDEKKEATSVAQTRTAVKAGEYRNEFSVCRVEDCQLYQFFPVSASSTAPKS